MIHCTFQGQPFILVGDLVHGGALTTIAKYEAFEASYAHLFADGSIKRYGAVIGHRDELICDPANTENVTPKLSVLECLDKAMKW